MAVSHYRLSISDKQPGTLNEAGSITSVDRTDLPTLQAMSLRRLLLKPGGMRTPHWHANAHELGYCLSGTALVTIAANHGEIESFVLEQGDMFFVPSGAAHHIQNIGPGTTELVLAFSDGEPEDFSVGQSFRAMSPSVLGNTFGLQAAMMSNLSGDLSRSEPIAVTAIKPAIGFRERKNSPFKYGLEAAQPQILSDGGSARTAKANVWPTLNGLAMFSLRISDRGMREPHWHPETTELGYVVAGRGCMSVLDAKGNVETYEMGTGDVYYIPRAYPHHIENIGTGDLHILVFFDRASPGDVGYRSVATAYSAAVMAAALNVPLAELPKFPFTAEDPLIVSRVNPVAPPQ